MNRTYIGCCSLWCQPDEGIGSKLRYLFRKGIPVTLSTGIGVAVNFGVNYFLISLKSSPQLIPLELSGVIGVFSTSIAYVLIDHGFEQCWHSNYQDNYREYSDNDFDAAINQLSDELAEKQKLPIHHGL